MYVLENIGKEMILNIGCFVGLGGFGIVYEVFLDGKKLVVKKMYWNMKNLYVLYESV